jgi:hypothetical protein
VFNQFYQNLTFQSILSRYDPPAISEAEIRRMREVLTLSGNNYDERFPATVRATEFWYWCGLRPERWNIVPDQALWNEFTREFELRRGQYIAKRGRRRRKRGRNRGSYAWSRLSFNGSSCESDWIVVPAYDTSSLTKHRLPQSENPSNSRSSHVDSSNLLSQQKV